MKITIEPGVLQGAVTPPPSKSHVHRLLIAAALCSGETAILCPGDNADIQATIRCLQALGVSVQRDARMIRISGPLQKTEKTELDCGESGSTLRFMLPLCAAQEKDWPILLTGHGRLPSRPNGPLLISGTFRIFDAKGLEIPALKMLSICRCGQTGSPPFCDGSHFKYGFSDE